jgi:hypothetical protein
MPDTTSYLHLGLAVIAGIVGLYIVSLVLRFLLARKDGEMSDE